MTKAKRSFDDDGGAVAAVTWDTHGTQRYRIGRALVWTRSWPPGVDRNAIWWLIWIAKEDHFVDSDRWSDSCQVTWLNSRGVNKRWSWGLSEWNSHELVVRCPATVKGRNIWGYATGHDPNDLWKVWSNECFERIMVFPYSYHQNKTLKLSVLSLSVVLWGIFISHRYSYHRDRFDLAPTDKSQLRCNLTGSE
jgi:hypothetical protein